MLNLPLKGVKVVDFTLFIAGPAVGKMLADWGADVIHVEGPSGDPYRGTGGNMGVPIQSDCNPLFNSINSNKKGLCLNMKTSEGHVIMDKLLSESDIFITSFRTGALERLSLDYETMSKKHPHIIWGQINGFGDFGPDKDNPGFDTVAFWARSGAMLDLAEKDTPPVNPLIGFGDHGTSCSLAAGLCAALFNKTKTGKGQKIMVSLLGQAIWNNSSPFIATQFGDEYPKTRTQPSMPFINSFKSKDGKWIFISVLEHDRYYNTVCKMVGRDDLVDDPRYATTLAAKAHSEEITKIFDKEFAKFTMDELVNLLKNNDIAHERIRGTHELLTDPQALENNYVYEVTHANGTKTFAAANPVKFGNIELNRTCDAPVIGEHSSEILSNLGYSTAEIKSLLDNKVVIEHSRKQAGTTGDKLAE
jgi:Predicted acyl-CoA transferases/carnitine dehydratase